MIPGNAAKKIGPTQMKALTRYPTEEYYAIRGQRLNELLMLAHRFNYTWDDAYGTGETRDWQNLINHIVSEIEEEVL